MVHDRDYLEQKPQLTFSHAELEAVLEAAKADEDVKPRTIAKLTTLKDYARTRAAYDMGPTIITIV